MNFLSHYYFFRNQDPYHNTGLVLPDLVRSFCKTHINPRENYTNPYFTRLNAGVLSHINTDRKFHNSLYFRNSTGYLSSVLDKEAQWPRKWFLNHILSEILMDRVLMDRHPHLCGEFYDNLEAVNPEFIVQYLRLSGVNNPQNFEPGFAKFNEIKFIFEYLDNENIIFALNRVYKRTGIEYTWTKEDKSLLLSQIPNILSYISENLGNLPPELK